MKTLTAKKLASMKASIEKSMFEENEKFQKFKTENKPENAGYALGKRTAYARVLRMLETRGE